MARFVIYGVSSSKDTKKKDYEDQIILKCKFQSVCIENFGPDYDGFGLLPVWKFFNLDSF